MPDEFPTLEVVALIGVLATIVSAWQLRSSLLEIPRLGRDLERALRSGDLEHARALCEEAEGAAFASVGVAIIEALAAVPPPPAAELRARLTAARNRAARAAQRGRGRDLVVAAVLVGAGAYAIRASLGVGTAFYALVATALLITALSPLLRRRALRALTDSSTRLLEAALAYASERTRSGAPCPECGAFDALKLDATVLGAAAELGLPSLVVCRRCGAARGRLEHPERIVPDAARGIQLVEATRASAPTPEREPSR